MVSSVREASMKVIPDRYVSLRNAAGILGFNQPPISLSEFVRKDIPIDWPLGDGDYEAGFNIVTDIPVSSKIGFVSGGGFDRPDNNKAIIYYPATEAGENASLAAGFFPLIVFGHAKRDPLSSSLVCPGTPTDITQDFRQLSGIFAHLASWGFVTISPDLSWMTSDAHDFIDKSIALNDAISYMVAENSRLGSPFNGKIPIGGFGAMGHSAGGLATIYRGTATPRTPVIDAMALIAPAATSTSDISRIETFAPNPVMIIHGTNDTGTYGADDQPLKIYAKAGAKKHLVTINGANHFGYTDSICLLPNGDGTAYISQATQQRIARAYLIAFFRRYLKGVLAMDAYLP